MTSNHCKNILNEQDVKCVIEKSLGPNVNILNYHVENYSNENLGFMGSHKNLIVELIRDESKVKETHTYFLKTVPYNQKSQAKFLEDSGMFHKEVSFYNLIMPELMKNSNDKSWAAQCYLTKDDVLVFENLKLKNYTVKGKFLDEVSLRSALSSLAKMHAASLIAEKRLGKTFLQMYPQLMNEILFTVHGQFAEWYKSAIVISKKVAENLGLNHELVPKVCDMILEKVIPSKTRRNVISHGDTWSNNFMFNESNCALVDFQLMRYVPPMVDVAQAIYFNGTKELREKCENELLKHYYNTFCDVLKSGGMISPSFEDILEEYEEMKVVGIVSISMYFPVQHLPKEKMDEMMKGSEGFQDLFCRDRLSLVLQVMEEDERYRKLITSVVRELVDMAEKLFK